jgi:GT2 family glycosyltransferase
LPDGPDVSVVVPVRNGDRYLPTLFARLEEQTLPRSRFEVVVVDDGSSDGTRELATAWAAEDPERRLVVPGPGRGRASARNAGVRRARGAWIASTDCDVVPEPRWLEAALDAARATGAAAVEGAIRPLAREARGPHDTHQDSGTGGRYMTGNMLYRRDLLDELGGFDERFDTFLEDSDLAYRILDAGHEIPFAPEACVHHPVVDVSPRDVLRQTRRLSWVPLFAATHPERFQTQFRPLLPPLTTTDVHVLVGLGAGAGAVAARGAARGVLLAVLAHGLVRGLRGAHVTYGPRAELPERAALAVALPVVKAWWLLVGAVRFRRPTW